jgi:hypothetical protein
MIGDTSFIFIETIIFLSNELILSILNHIIFLQEFNNNYKNA